MKLKKDAACLEVDDSRGYAAWPGIFGARIQSNKPSDNEPFAENGDAYLINLGCNIFAVADSTEWDSNIAKQFLTKFNNNAEKLFALHKDFSNAEKLELFLDELISSTNQLIEAVHYPLSTTFTCLIILPHQNFPKAIILHSGDSCLYKINTRENQISQISKTDLNLVGRAAKLSQTSLIEFDQNSQFIICSDGLQILTRLNGYSSLGQVLLESMNGHSNPEAVPDILLDEYGRDLMFNDDITIIVVNPWNLPNKNQVLIKGGPDYPTFNGR